MILADSSVWIDHLRQSNARLQYLLDCEDILIHPFIIGELALGSLKNRSRTIGELSRLEAVARASDAEVSALIEAEGLFNRGIGYVDACLLASVLLTDDCWLWTRDRRLHAIAARLDIAAPPS